ncbi:alpha carbonic anhydrase [Sphaerosporella brunnea]|uniref:Carbonic anhydrase n=1 Tax=Sphaerosporella brunnea TaxID=1250544 RepID=A0A5J5EM84_9PEZI|nr:alpha carbonic anhydrase [Sphaerosporella brunnea]
MYKHGIIALLLLAARNAAASCVHNTSLKPRAEDGAVPISTFGYTGLTGPFNWAGLDAANIACSTSRTQSPINLNSSTASKLSTRPTFSFNNVSSAEFENLGTTIEVLATGTTTISGKAFTLKQFHFHSPSEHRIDEEYFPLEMHMVHEAADGDGAIAVVAVLFEIDAVDATQLLKAVTRNIDKIQRPGSKTETAGLDFAELTAHLRNAPLLTYQGSLTTPPCAEGLTFIVPQKPMPLDVDTYRKIKGTVKFNARYTQNEAGLENILELGCKAVDEAKKAAPEPSSSTVESVVSPSASAVTATGTLESTLASTVAHASSASPTTTTTSCSSSQSASPTAAAEDSVTLVEGHHCIAGACVKRPAATAAKVRRRSRWERY